ncbi:hypothetical protein OH77DRAFT_1434071 [Trametes cingulata]|nr:hypothetical protein OH77DRAFT_1434071 [Trametes cingulata]
MTYIGLSRIARTRSTIGLSSKVAQYAAACKLPGFTLDENAPYAELWMGTHHSSPSRLASTQEPLSAHLSAHPELMGARVVERFRAAGAAEANLPFLFKVLAIGKALSIQTHPDKGMAERLHQERPDVYKDANHKPEMALALTPFQALCGFLPLPRIAEFLAAVPEFAALVPPSIISQFYTAAASSDPAGPCEKAALKDVFSAVMTADPDVFPPQLEKLVRRYEEAEEGKEGKAKVHEVEREVRELVLRLHGQFPGDTGVFCAFMLNDLTLEPGQAIFLAAGEPHAYVSGDMVECMAMLDNVIRARLTPPDLLAIPVARLDAQCVSVSLGAVPAISLLHGMRSFRASAKAEPGSRRIGKGVAKFSQTHCPQHRATAQTTIIVASSSHCETLWPSSSGCHALSKHQCPEPLIRESPLPNASPNLLPHIRVSAMHRCIFIDEIVRKVAEELLLMDRHDTLAKLARTCKALHEAVLPVLWMRLVNLHPLERLVRRVVRENPPAVGRARLRHYMRHVREFHWSHGGQYTAIREFNDATLAEPQVFPQLRVLKWRDTRPEVFPYVLRLLAPTLRDLCIFTLHYASSEIIALLQTVPLVCTELRTFHLRIDGWHRHMLAAPQRSEVAEPLVQCIAKMPHLREFAAEICFAGNFLAPLGALPELEMLELTCPQLVELTSPATLLTRLSSGQPWFPSLRRLSLYLRELNDTFLDFIRSIQSTRLAELAIRVYRTPSGDLLQQQLATIVRMPLHRTLHSFSLFCVEDLARGHMPVVVDAGHALRPLYSLPHMKHISLRLNHLVVDPRAINDIAQAWGQLETLSLLGNYAHPPSRGLLTLQNLVPLAQRCPQLAKLVLHFSATSPPSERDLARLFPRPSLCQLRTLVAHDAPIANLGAVAEFMRRAFPQVREVAYKPLDEALNTRIGHWPVNYDGEWKTVQKMLRGRSPLGKQEVKADGRAHMRGPSIWDGFPYASFLFD